MPLESELTFTVFPPDVLQIVHVETSEGLHAKGIYTSLKKDDGPMNWVQGRSLTSATKLIVKSENSVHLHLNDLVSLIQLHSCNYNNNDRKFSGSYEVHLKVTGADQATKWFKVEAYHRPNLA